jgi:hypothetical protein
MSNQVIKLLIAKSDFTSDKLIPQNTEDEKINKSIRDAQQFDLRPLLGDAFYYDLVKNFQASKILVTYTNLAVAAFTVNETVKADNGALGKVLINAAGVLTLEFAGSTSWTPAVSITGLLNLATADVADVSFTDVDKYNKLIEGEEYVNAAGHTIIFSGLRMAVKYWAMARFRTGNQSTTTSHSTVIKTSPYSIPQDRKVIGEEATQDRQGASAYWHEAVSYLNTKHADFPLWNCTNKKTKTGIKIRAIGGDSRR